MDKRITLLASLILSTREIKKRDYERVFITYDIDKLPTEIKFMFQEACQLAHNGELPNDTIYKYIDNVLSIIASEDPSNLESILYEQASNDVSVYHYDLLQWFAENLSRIDLVDQIAGEYGVDQNSIINLIQLAQSKFISDIYITIYNEFINFLDSNLEFNNFELI